MAVPVPHITHPSHRHHRHHRHHSLPHIIRDFDRANRDANRWGWLQMARDGWLSQTMIGNRWQRRAPLTDRDPVRTRPDRPNTASLSANTELRLSSVRVLQWWEVERSGEHWVWLRRTVRTVQHLRLKCWQIFCANIRIKEQSKEGLSVHWDHN